MQDLHASSALTLAGTALVAAALADFLLGAAPGLGLPSPAVLFVALTAAGFLLTGISLGIAEPDAPRLLAPLGTDLFGTSLVHFLAGRRSAAQQACVTPVGARQAVPLPPFGHRLPLRPAWHMLPV